MEGVRRDGTKSDDLKPDQFLFSVFNYLPCCFVLGKDRRLHALGGMVR